MRPGNLIVLDENLNPELGEELTKRGYKATSVRDLDLLSVKDEHLLPHLGKLYRDRRWTLATTDLTMPKRHARAVVDSGCALAILENAAEDGRARSRAPVGAPSLLAISRNCVSVFQGHHSRGSAAPPPDLKSSPQDRSSEKPHLLENRTARRIVSGDRDGLADEPARIAAGARTGLPDTADLRGIP